MPGSMTRTGLVDTPGRLAPATVGNPVSVPAALGRCPGTRPLWTPGARRGRLQGPRRARHGRLSWFPVPGPRSAVPRRTRQPARRLPGRLYRIQEREAGAHGRLGCPPGCVVRAHGRPRGSRVAGRLLPGRAGRACRESLGCAMGACDRRCRGRQGGAHRPGRRPGPAAFRPGHPRRTREPGRRRSGLLCQAPGPVLGGGGRQDRRRGAREFRAGPARGAGSRPGRRPGRAGLGWGRGMGGRGHRGRCPGSWHFVAGRPRRGWLAGIPAGHRGPPGARRCVFLVRARQCAFPARACRRRAFPARACRRCAALSRARHWPPRPRDARRGNLDPGPGPGPPEGRSQAVLCPESHRARGHPARQCRPGHDGPDRPAHPDNPWRERILLRG
jgi:hypothetical protein